MSNAECLFGSAPLPDYSRLALILDTFNTNYSSIHPFLALFICSAGIVMNIITMLVLVRPPMISPITVILFAVAGCDLIVMVTYLIFVLHFLMFAANRCRASDYNFGWAVFTMFHAHTSVIFHATSIWLTVLLAQIRILTLAKKKKGRRMVVTIRFTIFLSLITCVIMLFVNIPNILTFEIIAFNADSYMYCRLINDDVKNSTNAAVNSYEKDSTYRKAVSETVYMVIPSQKDCVKLRLAFWTNGLCFKVFPCILLTASIVVLVKIITGVSKKRRSLAKLLKRRKLPKDRISPILIVVLTIFLVTELPQGVLLMLTGIFSSTSFHEQIYLPLGDFMDLLSLINSAVNFVIYCTMSKNFRRVLFLMLKKRQLSISSRRGLDNVTALVRPKKKQDFKRFHSDQLDKQPRLFVKCTQSLTKAIIDSTQNQKYRKNLCVTASEESVMQEENYL